VTVEVVTASRWRPAKGEILGLVVGCCARREGFGGQERIAGKRGGAWQAARKSRLSCEIGGNAVNPRVGCPLQYTGPGGEEESGEVA